MPLTQSCSERNAALKGLGQSDPLQIWFLFVVIGCLEQPALKVCGHCSLGHLVTLISPVTFALGLDFWEDWLRSLIDPTDWADEVVKGADGCLWSIAVAFKLTGLHGSWFLERKVPESCEAVRSSVFYIRGLFL